MEDILSLFHHIHHTGKEHNIHHCGGKHEKVNKNLNYNIGHCSCKKHSIDKEFAIGHATNGQLKSVEIKIQFLEKCPNGGWHIESGVRCT